MHIDLRTVTLEPLRHTYDHVARHVGADKPASRYLEGTVGLQATANFHYRPTWDPAHAIFDAARTAIVMADWDQLKDPRQFYYGAYTLARARQQETTEASFEFVEGRDLLAALPPALAARLAQLLVPLRHVAWGANLNNAAIAAYGYGAPFTQPCVYHAMDHLGIAQYLSRIGLLLGDTDALDAGKRAWLDDPLWQPLRHCLEDSFVVTDPVELFVAQNLVLDGLLYALVYQGVLEHHSLQAQVVPLAMLTQFMTEWSAETRKWVDAVVKRMAAESPENAAQLAAWVQAWRTRVIDALRPVAGIALAPEDAEAVLQQAVADVDTRLAKAGISL